MTNRKLDTAAGLWYRYGLTKSTHIRIRSLFAISARGRKQRLDTISIVNEARDLSVGRGSPSIARTSSQNHVVSVLREFPQHVDGTQEFQYLGYSSQSATGPVNEMPFRKRRETKHQPG